MPKVETFNREDIIEKATVVFHDKGYNATSMQDLVDATGLNRSSIYNSFVSKLDLYLECLRAYEAQSNRMTTKLLLRSDNPKQAIQLIFNAFIDVICSKEEEKGCLIGNCKAEMANHETAITNFLNQNQTRTIDLFEDLIAQGQDQGLFNTKKSSREYALYLYTSVQGFRMTGILLNERDELSAIADTILQSLE